MAQTRATRGQRYRGEKLGKTPSLPSLPPCHLPSCEGTRFLPADFRVWNSLSTKEEDFTNQVRSAPAVGLSCARVDHLPLTIMPFGLFPQSSYKMVTFPCFCTYHFLFSPVESGFCYNWHPFCSVHPPTHPSPERAGCTICRSQRKMNMYSVFVNGKKKSGETKMAA